MGRSLVPVYLETWGKPVAFYRSVGCRSKCDYGPKIFCRSVS